MKTNPSLALTIAVCCWLGCLQVAEAQEAAGPPASIEDVAWIAGHWQGQAMGGQFEETWNPPLANAMMGMFKFVQDDKIGFYEILTIVPQENSLILRLKHFHGDLKGWEEKDQSVDFPLVAISQDEARFDGLTFKKTGPDRMLITVVVDRGDGGKEIEFECQRAPSPEVSESAMQTVLKLDELLSQQRNEATRQVALNQAIQQYVANLEQLDFDGCPPEFVAAFQKHRLAWQASIEFFASHQDLRGEMHEVFKQIATHDKNSARQLKTHLDSIMETWRAVQVFQNQGTER